MRLMATQAERRAATRAALIRAAVARFGADGFDAVSIDGVAAAADVTRGAVYHHFDGKEALFEAAFRSVEAELRKVVRRAAASKAEPRSRLLDGCRAFVRATSERGTNRIVLLDAPAVLGWAAYKRIDEEYFLEDTANAIRAIRPEATPDRTTLLARALIAVVCELSLRVARTDDAADAADEVLGTFIRAL